MRDSVAMEKLYKTRIKFTHELLAIFMSVLLGCGVFMLVIALGNGNWLVLAAPLAFWLGLVSLPTNSVCSAGRMTGRRKRTSGVAKGTGQRWGWRLCLAGAMWFIAGAGLLSRVGKLGVSDANIAAAMDEGAEKRFGCGYEQFVLL